MPEPETHPYSRDKQKPPKLPAWFWPCLINFGVGIGAWAHVMIWQLSGRLTVVETNQTHDKVDITDVKTEVKSVQRKVEEIGRDISSIQTTQEIILYEIRKESP